MVELSYSDLSLLEATVYRFAKDNKIDMSEQLYKDCAQLYGRLRELEKLPNNFDV